MTSNLQTDQAYAMRRRRVLGLASTLAISSSSLLISAASSAAKAETPQTVTGNQELPWPPVGNFAGKAMVGPHQSAAEVMLDKSSLLDLPPQASFFYGNLRDPDGNLSEWVRNFNIATGMTRQGLFVQSSAGRDTLRAFPAAFIGACPDYVATLENGTAVWKSPPNAKGKPFFVTMSADGSAVSWKEEGGLDITGTLLGPGLQWYIPDTAGSELYVSQIYEMKGTALGKPVRGVMAFDKVYLPAGIQLYGGKDPLFRPEQHHRIWYTWGTVYRDGTYDAGHFVLGTDRLGFALLTNERQDLVLDTNVTGDVTLLPGEPWPEKINIRTSAGVELVFVPDPKGQMRDMLGTGVTTAFTPQTEGRWHRKGDTREPEVWFAWGEVAPRGRTGYSETYKI